MLLGRDAQATQPVRLHDSRGRHTTTHRQLFARPGGGCIIDTPGMRAVESWIGEVGKSDEEGARPRSEKTSAAFRAEKKGRGRRDRDIE